ncbi:hypothetical protein GIB67_023278 [Kingdonia uniflora]|nr:hypothetical protein GIB67_023278 [Kingdonia uniflora]
MADALISVVVKQLAPFLLDKLKEEVKLVLGAPEDVQELHDTFDKIRDVLDDAEKRHVKNALLNLEKNEIKKVPESAWLEKLKDVSYEMEDVLDEWQTKIQKLEIAADESSAPDGVDGAHAGKKKAWHNHLCQSLEGKLFLLILDDVWIKDRASWDQLKLALDLGKKGSRIVVTTRNDTVAMTVGTTDKHNLQQLSDDDCWLFFF